MAKREKWIDSKGRDVPAEYVPAYLKRRDRFVRKFRARTEKTSAALVALHAELQEAFPAYIDRAAASYDVQVGGEKGNVELLSFDGLTKLVRRNHDSLAFDERLGFARESIDKAMQTLCRGANPGVLPIIRRAWMADRDGNLRRSRVLDLLTLDISDPDFRKGQELIRESMATSSSKYYYALYVRDDRDSPWRNVPLNMSTL